MDGEVGPVLAVLPGAVERIDDPHARGLQPGGVVLALLAQHGVVGAQRGQARSDELVRGAVAARAQVVGRGPVRDRPG